MYRIPVVKVQLIRESTLQSEYNQVRSSLDVARILKAYLEGTDREHFVLFLLDQKNKVKAINTVSTGSLTASVVHPREVFKPAILNGCASIAVGHNHPSGDPQPSREDRTLTERLKAAGDLLGVKVLDHIIIGDGTDKYFSFADEGIL